jgi:homoserine dehydrogenase
MKTINIALLGCGTVGGGVAQILLQLNHELNSRANANLVLKKIVDLYPQNACQRFNIPLDLFCGGGKNLSSHEAGSFIQEIIKSDDIDIIIETIGGDNDFVLNIALDTLKANKHFITANKALLAKYGKKIFDTAGDNKSLIGFEASVCGAIPIIKTIKESFTGDEIMSISGIFNGTSNYILTNMQKEGLEFKDALKAAQKNGYAESDPSLDINGGDAANKLIILIKLAFGIDLTIDKLFRKGIEDINKDDLDFAQEMNLTLKLICFAEKKEDEIYALVCPMMVKENNFLSKVNNATNAVQIINKYSGRHLLVGAGAGSLETASAIVSDIIFTTRYHASNFNKMKSSTVKLIDSQNFIFPYCIIFETEDVPGITGVITTAIGNQRINIDTVGHNRHNKEKAIFPIITMPCSMKQINAAIQEIKKIRPDIIINDPKIFPILN